jgi:hypothetical protein
MIFFGCHMRAAEGFGAIADQHQGLRSNVGDLVVIFRAKKNDLIFFNDAFFSLESFDGGFPLEHQEGLRGHVIVHVRVLARTEVKDPRTKIVCAEERDKSLVLFFRRSHRVVDICKLHSLSFDESRKSCAGYAPGLSVRQIE